MEWIILLFCIILMHLFQSLAKANLWFDKFGFLSMTKKKDKITVDMWKYASNYIGPGRQVLL